MKGSVLEFLKYNKTVIGFTKNKQVSMKHIINKEVPYVINYMLKNSPEYQEIIRNKITKYGKQYQITESDIPAMYMVPEYLDVGGVYPLYFDNEFAGFMSLIPSINHQESETSFMLSLYLLKQFQNLGIGKICEKQAILLAVENGYTIECSTKLNNEIALKTLHNALTELKKQQLIDYEQYNSEDGKWKRTKIKPPREKKEIIDEYADSMIKVILKNKQKFTNIINLQSSQLIKDEPLKD